MAIHYSVIPIKNPRNRDVPAKYYAKAQATGVCSLDELAEDIAYSTTATDGDVMNVLRALIVQIRRHIQMGEIVRLENLGSFQAQLSSNGAESADMFHTANIRKVRLQFRPGVGLSNTIRVDTLKFKEVPILLKPSAPSSPESGILP